jgi:hypothetical protein
MDIHTISLFFAYPELFITNLISESKASMASLEQVLNEDTCPPAYINVLSKKISFSIIRVGIDCTLKIPGSGSNWVFLQAGQLPPPLGLGYLS